MRINLSLLSIILAFVAGCSTRIEYDRTPASVGSPNAININVAPVADLEKLPGIGRKTAESIIEYRTENGPFRRVEHIMLIRGISEERFYELRPYLGTE